MKQVLLIPQIKIHNANALSTSKSHLASSIKGDGFPSFLSGFRFEIIE
jgi:hypothetical protein